jgi:PAS domain S-box-containing protein
MSATEGQIPDPLELRSFLNRIPTMAWSALADGSLDFFNQPFRDYVGLSPDQLYGLGWKSAIHSNDIRQFETWWQNLRQSQEAGTTEVRLRRFDGSPRWFLIFANPVRDESGNLVRWYGTNLDIEDRKRADEIQQARELPWRQIVDNIPGLVATMDAKGEVEFLNRQTLQYFGKTSEDLKNWALTDVVHPDDLTRIIEARIKAIEEGRIYEVEHRCRRADGAYRWFQVRGLPVRDPEDKITAWYLLLTDIDDRKRAEEKLQQSESDFRTITNNIPGFVHTMSPTGEVEFLNNQILEYFGRPGEELKDWTRAGVVHPDDLPRVVETFNRSIATGQTCEVELRCRRADGVYRWFQSRGRPVRNAKGQITTWYFLLTDIDDRKRAEQKLEQSEEDLRTITDSIPQPIVVLSPDGKTLYVNQVALDLTGFTMQQLDEKGFWARIVHPEDVHRLRNQRQERLLRGNPFELEFRALYKNGQYRWQLMQYNPLKDDSGQIIRWYSTATDIDDRKRAEEKLRRSEQELRTITDTIRQPIVVLAPDGSTIYANRVALDLTGLAIDELDKKGLLAQTFHPHDVARLSAERHHGVSGGAPFDSEVRVLFKGGQYRWHLLQYNPLKDESGQIIRWYATATDIDDRKRAEEKLRKSEEELRTITDAIRQPIVVLAPDGTTLYANRVALDITGLTIEDIKSEGFSARAFHPDDLNRFRDERRTGLSAGVAFDLEMRSFLTNGQHRWQLLQYNPLKDEHGQIIRWYVTATDIDDRKKTEERLRNENLVLREEIDRSSMFEEIVGSSKPIHQLLKKVEKVAPSDSTVLILGETGTGKELIARALHRRSKRSNRAFVRVNCAAIPQSLIASELFGHEKGAFTGALQRRVGRFEAANGGTLFLDEIGELPMETQIALLRVLQEREFERVGSNHPISVDVRLIAATNRDLPAAVAAGTFRQDLFFRLNVFPIAVPSLRERAEDIPLLVEYFVGRYAKEAGKNIRQIGKHTLEQLQSYRWTGNIRELQNVVERAVILCETDTFVVDESWLESESEESSQREGLSALEEREVEMIEAALAETHGRISGPSGAAAKLGIPRQTLESKIRRLGIDKYVQKRATSK